MPEPESNCYFGAKTQLSMNNEWLGRNLPVRRAATICFIFVLSLSQRKCKKLFNFWYGWQQRGYPGVMSWLDLILIYVLWLTVSSIIRGIHFAELTLIKAALQMLVIKFCEHKVTNTHTTCHSLISSINCFMGATCNIMNALLWHVMWRMHFMQSHANLQTNHGWIIWQASSLWLIHAY